MFPMLLLIPGDTNSYNNNYNCNNNSSITVGFCLASYFSFFFLDFLSLGWLCELLEIVRSAVSIDCVPFWLANKRPGWSTVMASGEIPAPVIAKSSLIGDLTQTTGRLVAALAEAAAECIT